jgi:hypothetical protein
MYTLYPLKYAQGFNDIFVDEGRDYHLRPTATRYGMSGETFISINITLLLLCVILVINCVFLIKKSLAKSQFED